MLSQEFEGIRDDGSNESGGSAQAHGAGSGSGNVLRLMLVQGDVYVAGLAKLYDCMTRGLGWR